MKPLCLATWNANGLAQRKNELEVFLKLRNIDAALIAETHFTNWSRLKIPGYKLYNAVHPSGKARGGSAVVIKNEINHHELPKICTKNFQVTSVCVQHGQKKLILSAIYCPPNCKTEAEQFKAMLGNLGDTYIIGGDWNAKHTHWASRLINPRGRELLTAIYETRSSIVTTPTPTYWPTDLAKKPDVLDFFITKGISQVYLEAEALEELSSDHIPVVLRYNTMVTRQSLGARSGITSRRTNWDQYRQFIDENINMRARLRTKQDIDDCVERFTKILQDAAQVSTPEASRTNKKAGEYPEEIKKLVTEKRKARRKWHQTRLPRDKANLNRLTKEAHERIQEHKNSEFQNYLKSLTPHKDTDYSLYKATKGIKHPIEQNPPLKKSDGGWASSDRDKADRFSEHLETVFSPHPPQGDEYFPPRSSEEGGEIKPFKPIEVANMIDKNVNVKKAPGFDKITGRMLKELPRKAIVHLTCIYNAIVRLQYVPENWKKAQVLMIPKPGKPKHEASSYRPISLLPVLSKLFEKLLLLRLEPIITAKKLIPDHQFGFRKKHSTVQQVHRIADKIRRALEEKKYCSAVFLDVEKAFDKVWHKGLIDKLRAQLPTKLVNIFESYLDDRKFRVVFNQEYSKWCNIQAGVPQGSVLGPIMYLMYTADIPLHNDMLMATFADDAGVMAVDDDYNKSARKLQESLQKVHKWTQYWRIKINATKSKHIIFTLRSYRYQPATMGGKLIPKADAVRYLGIHLDVRLNWKEHIRIKKLQVKDTMRKLYWLMGRQSPVSLESKKLIYVTVVKPIWMYGLEVWGCASISNINTMESCQNVALRTIVGAYRFERNADIRRDLRIATVKEEISLRSGIHLTKLDGHVNEEAQDIVRNAHGVHRLKRPKFSDLPTRFQ
jgi:hypothetical protein